MCSDIEKIFDEHTSSDEDKAWMNKIQDPNYILGVEIKKPKKQINQNIYEFRSKDNKGSYFIDMDSNKTIAEQLKEVDNGKQENQKSESEPESPKQDLYEKMMKCKVEVATAIDRAAYNLGERGEHNLQWKTVPMRDLVSENFDSPLIQELDNIFDPNYKGYIVDFRITQKDVKVNYEKMMGNDGKVVNKINIGYKNKTEFINKNPSIKTEVVNRNFSVQADQLIKFTKTPSEKLNFEIEYDGPKYNKQEYTDYLNSLIGGKKSCDLKEFVKQRIRDFPKSGELVTRIEYEQVPNPLDPFSGELVSKVVNNRTFNVTNPYELFPPCLYNDTIKPVGLSNKIHSYLNSGGPSIFEKSYEKVQSLMKRTLVRKQIKERVRFMEAIFNPKPSSWWKRLKKDDDDTFIVKYADKLKRQKLKKFKIRLEKVIFNLSHI